LPQKDYASHSVQSKPKIKVDLEKIQRVFVNIISNAFDAMPEGGKLAIKSKKINDNLEIAFIDTDVGMPREAMEKIEKPLFTTKTKETGLGLAIYKRAVGAHGGKISLESEVGKGTALKIILPIKPKLKGGEGVWMKLPESSLSMTTKA